MENTAIAIFAWQRPHYLYILLHSLSLAKGIEKYPIFVYFDKINDNMRILQGEILTNFPLLSITPFFHTEQQKVVKNILSAYQKTFDKGYDNVIMFEEDVIVRTDFLQYFDSVAKSDDRVVFLSLRQYKPRLVCRYLAYGNMLNKKHFPPLRDWITNKKYVGRPTYDGKATLTEKWGHDAIFTRYMLDHELLTLSADKHYVVHVGIGGIHYPLSEICKQARDTVFKDKRETWLHNMIKLAMSDYHKELEPVLCPRGFKYDV